MIIRYLNPIMSNTDVVAEKPCFAQVGMRNQRFCG